MFDVIYQSSRKPFKYWANVTVQDFLKYFCSSNNMDGAKKYCMKVEDAILSDSDLIPFFGYSSPIFIYCLDITVAIKYNNGIQKIAASNQMTIGDLRDLFYQQYISGNGSKSDAKSYRLFNVATKERVLLDEGALLQTLITRGNLNLELAQPLFVNFNGKMTVHLKHKFKTVGDFLSVLLFSWIEM